VTLCSLQEGAAAYAVGCCWLKDFDCHRIAMDAAVVHLFSQASAGLARKAPSGGYRQPVCPWQTPSIGARWCLQSALPQTQLTSRRSMHFVLVAVGAVLVVGCRRRDSTRSKARDRIVCMDMRRCSEDSKPTPKVASSIETETLEGFLQETRSRMQMSIGDAEDADRLHALYVNHASNESFGVITKAGLCNIRDHISLHLSPSEQPTIFVDLGSGDGVGVVSAARYWARQEEYWGVELDAARHRTASRALLELRSTAEEASQRCFLVNENLLHVPPLLSMKAVFFVSNVSWSEELTKQVGTALDCYAPAGALVFSSAAIPMVRGESCPGGSEIPCPQSWDSSATVQARRLCGVPTATPCKGTEGFTDALRAAFVRYAEPSGGCEVLASAVPAAISEALLAIAKPAQIAHLIWHVAGGRHGSEISDPAAATIAEKALEREEFLNELREEAQAEGLSLECLRAAYGELERLDEEEDEDEKEASSPWRCDWHAGALDDSVLGEPSAEGTTSHLGTGLNWDTFERLGRRAKSRLATSSADFELEEGGLLTDEHNSSIS